LFKPIKEGEFINDEMDELLKPYKCPITYSVINNPVVASDGITYEKTAI